MPKQLNLIFGRGDNTKHINLTVHYNMPTGILTSDLWGVTKEVALASLVDKLLNEYEFTAIEVTVHHATQKTPKETS